MMEKRKFQKVHLDKKILNAKKKKIKILYIL